MSVDNNFTPAGGTRANKLNLALGEWRIDNVPVTATAAQINAAAGDAFGWTVITGNSQVLFPQNGYVPLSTSLTNFYLPATIAAGQLIRVAGFGSGGWKINQMINQQIYCGTSSTTPGVSGYLASQTNTDGIEIICVVTDLVFLVIGMIGRGITGV